MVVFGGLSDTTHLNDVWALGFSGTPTWTQLAPAGAAPGPRNLPAAVYDGAGQRMLIFAGASNFQWAVHNDVWALSLTGSPAWTELTPASGPAPAPREGPSAIYDPARNRMVVFAGINANSYLADVWSLSLAGTPVWSQITPGTGPCPRDGAGAVYDPGADRMLVFGGEFFADGCPSGFFNDVWSLPLSGAPAWSELAPSGAAPAARLGQGVAHDPARRRMLVYGGYGYDQYARPIISHTMNDTWALSLGETPAWSLLDSGPRPETGRWDLASAYDAARDRWIVFGGSAGIETVDRLGDLWAAPLDRPSAWTALAATGTPPPPLSNSAAVIDSAGERMFVIGGFDGAYENQVWLLELAGAPTWSPIAVEGTPPPPAQRAHRGPRSLAQPGDRLRGDG